MLLSSLLVVTGVILGAILARYRRVHLGGIVLIPVVAIFALRSVVVFPLFVLGLAMAYAAIHIVRRYVLLYGLRLRGLAIATGAVPTGLAVATGVEIEVVAVAASALPGLVALYLHHQSWEQQETAIVTYGSAVTALGVGGITAVTASFTPPCVTCGVVPWSAFQPVLLDRGTDVALFLGYGFRTARPELEPLIAIIGIVGIAVVLAETVEAGWGFGFFGAVDLPVLVVLALRARLALAVYLVIGIGCYVALTVVHRRTLIHGPPLLAIAITVAALAVLWPALAFEAADGVGMFAAGLLAAVGAYQLHKTTSADRPAAVLSGAGVFVVAFAAGRGLLVPLSDGLGQTIGIPHLAVGGLLVGAAAWTLYSHGPELLPRQIGVGG